MSKIQRAVGADQQKRLDYLLSRIEEVLGHRDRREPMRGYCTGLLLAGERKSVEPMAAKLEPGNVRQKHQSLHHFVADAPWKDQAVLDVCVDEVMIAMKHQVAAWIVDDTGNPKKGSHSVGVARQYCGVLGKEENCQVAVSLSLANEHASIPVAYRLYLPESWTKDRKRLKQAKVPKDIVFENKNQIALAQIESAKERGLPLAPVLADAGYGKSTEFRRRLTSLGFQYAVGVQTTACVWTKDIPPPAPTPKGHVGRPRKRVSSWDRGDSPPNVRQVALALPAKSYKNVTWREGTRGKMRSRFAAVRVRAAHHDDVLSDLPYEEWLVIEWPRDEKEPTKYWLSTLPANATLSELVSLYRMRWRIERDYQELKDELGLDHFEGRSWRGFHHHATMCIAAYAFLVTERLRFSPLSTSRRTQLLAPAELPEGFRPRGSAAA